MPYSLPSLGLAALFFTAVHAATMDPSASSRAPGLLNAAVTLPNGQYTITNVGDSSDQWTYDTSNGKSIIPGDGSQVTVQKIDGDSVAFMVGNEKCLSAQWTGNYDGMGVLYSCAVGPWSGGGTGTLRLAKQQWLVIPAGGNVASVSGVSQVGTGKNVTSTKSGGHHKSTHKHKSSHKKKCRHSAKWLKRHPQYITKKHHPECKAVLHHRRDRLFVRDIELAQRDVQLEQRELDDASVGVVKRGSGAYFICAVDHLTDQATRCVTDQAGKALSSDGSKGFVLAEMDTSDQSQMWTFT